MHVNSPHFLRIEPVYVDGSMVQLQTSFASSNWSGRGTAYTQFEDIAQFASRLSSFGETCSGNASFVAGRLESPIGYLSLHFYPVDRTGHFVCHLRLATDASTEHRPEEIWTVSIELASEAAALDTFIAGLRGIAETQSGIAFLRLSE